MTRGGREVSAVAICEWYVAPGHKGQALGKRMVQSFTTPDNFLYTFSLSQAAVENFKKLGWVGPWQASLLALPLPRLVKVPISLFSGRAGADLRDHIVTNGHLSAETSRSPMSHWLGRPPHIPAIAPVS